MKLLLDEDKKLIGAVFSKIPKEDYSDESDYILTSHKSGKEKRYYFFLEVQPNQLVLRDTCNRMVPFLKSDIPDLIEALEEVYNK